MPYSLGFHRVLDRTLHANYRLGPALSGATPSSSIEAPCIVYKNGPNSNTAVTVTTPRQRYYSSTSNRLAKVWKHNPPRTYKWVTLQVSEDLYDELTSHILDSSRMASEGFPVASENPNPEAKKDSPETLNRYNPQNQSPPAAGDPNLELDPDTPKRLEGPIRAVVVDCEMVSLAGGEQGLLKIAAVDFFTGDVVLHTIVDPGRKVTDWRKGITGFNKARLGEFKKKRKVISGWEAVRQELFNVTNSDTIFIGHALACDLRVLRIAPTRVVDSMLMLSRAVFGDVRTFQRHWSLKTAFKEFLNEEVQKTRGPHKPLEDALASRELVVQSIQSPERLARFGAHIRKNLADIEAAEQAKEDKKKEKRERKLAAIAAMTPLQRMERVAEQERKAEEKRHIKMEVRARLKREKAYKLQMKRDRKRLSKIMQEADEAHKKAMRRQKREEMDAEQSVRGRPKPRDRKE
ncbi:ribonuclease H-like domain-containing protein [Hypoxylon argillaceum]|nr:ribonuclease H-like domain-containing protein [Hypoxylon argillaceum]